MDKPDVITQLWICQVGTDSCRSAMHDQTAVDQPGRDILLSISQVRSDNCGSDRYGEKKLSISQVGTDSCRSAS